MRTFTFDDVYRVTRSIPGGKVSTYGHIARVLGNKKLARVVGWALHGNERSDVPCHRVVNRHGELAETFGRGGIERQRQLLQAEGIDLIDQNTVDLDKHLFICMPSQ